MDVTDAIQSRIEVREYTDEPVTDGVWASILDAGRLAPSGKNLQHWRFILVEETSDLSTLAELSTTGGWIADAAFGVVVLTDPTYYYHELDAGRAITHMQFEAWAREIGSCIYTGYDDAGMHEFLQIPEGYAVTAVVGFGHPPFDVGALAGQKDRAPLSEIGHRGRFGTPLNRFDQA